MFDYKRHINNISHHNSPFNYCKTYRRNVIGKMVENLIGIIMKIVGKLNVTYLIYESENK